VPGLYIDGAYILLFIFLLYYINMYGFDFLLHNYLNLLWYTNIFENIFFAKKIADKTMVERTPNKYKKILDED